MFKPVKEDEDDLRDRNNQTDDLDKKETSCTPDSILDNDDRKSPSIASVSSLCSSDNKSKDSKRSGIDSDCEETTSINNRIKHLKNTRPRSRDRSESPSESFSDGSSVYGNDNDDNDDNDDEDDDNDDDDNNQDDLSSVASSITPTPHLDLDSHHHKPPTVYLKPPATNTVTIQTDNKTSVSDDDEDDDDDSDNSDSDSGSDSEESGSGQQEESTEDSTRPSSEAQSSTEEPPPPTQPFLLSIKTEPADPEPDHSQSGLPVPDGPEPIDVKPVIGVPPDFYPGLTPKTEVGINERASPSMTTGGPLPSADMSVTVSSTTTVSTSRPGSPGQEKASLQSTLAGLPPHMLASQYGLLPPTHQGLLQHHFLPPHHQGPLHAPPPLVPASTGLPPHGIPPGLEHHTHLEAHADHLRSHSPRSGSPGKGHLSDVRSRSPSSHMRSGSPHMGPTRSPHMSPHVRPMSPHMRQMSPHMRPMSPHMGGRSPPPSHMSSRTPPPPHRFTRTPPPHGGIPPLSRSPLSIRSSPPPPHSSHSPGARPQTHSDRPPSRSRSRSPLDIYDRDSDSEPEISRSPSPEAKIMNEECYKTKNAIFIKHWYRGRNTCSRCDLEFKPYADSPLARKRENRIHKLSTSSPQSGARDERKEDGSREREMARERERERERERDRDRDRDRDREHDRIDEKIGKKTPPENKSADAQVTSTLLSSSQQPPPPQQQHQHLPPYGPERHTPRAAYPPGHDPTPALRTLSEYARPHALGAQDLGRPYTSLSSIPPHAIDPYYRMASMYPPGSRERLELELERDKRERDERERQLRERELREMELREKMKHEMDLKPPGFDRMPPGAHMDPHFIELQRRMASLPPGAHPISHIPGVYPPASLASDLIQRERERIDRLGQPNPHNPNVYDVFRRSYTHEQVYLMQKQTGIPGGGLLAGIGGPHKPLAEQDLLRMSADPALLAAHFNRGDPLAGALIPPSHTLPPGHPLLAPAREQEILYRELLSRPPYNSDPVLAHQLTVQHEAIQRHLALERERMGGPPHIPH